MKLNVDRRSFRDVQRNIERLRRRWPEEVTKQMRRFAEGIMTESKDRYCPVRYGVMRGTGRVEEENLGLVLHLVYGGGPADAYTIDQHQNTSYHHPVGEDHFLSKPFNIYVPNLPAFIAKYARIDVVRL